jgi:hypothetical protein
MFTLVCVLSVRPQEQRRFLGQISVSTSHVAQSEAICVPHFILRVCMPTETDRHGSFFSCFGARVHLHKG